MPSSTGLHAAVSDDIITAICSVPHFNNLSTYTVHYPQIFSSQGVDKVQCVYMKYLSLFSGVGGFELGIQQAYETIGSSDVQKERGGEEVKEGINEERGGLHTIPSERALSENRQPHEHTDRGTNKGQPHCIGFSEIDKYTSKVYQHHFPNHKAYGDITQIDETELPDFDLLVGGFPCQSFSIAGKRGGFDDTRGTMFFEIARIVREKQPRLLLLENVKGLLSHDKGNTFRTIITTLDELGYDLQWQVLNSKDFGVPQNRERVFIIGHLRGTPRPEVFPIQRVGGQSDDIQPETKGQQPRILRNSESEGGYFASPKNWRDAQGRPIVRRLTPLECERLQGFPDNWTNVEGMSDTQRYKQMGNAVTVNVIQAIVSKLI